MLKYYPKNKKESTEKTAVGKTRLNPQVNSNPHGVSVHLDYGRFSLQGNKEDILDCINFLLDYSFDKQLAMLQEGKFQIAKNTRKYRYQYTGLYGARILFNLDTDDIPDDKSIHYHKASWSEVLLELPGSFFLDMSASEQYYLLCQLVGRWHMVCTRLDIAIDDSSYHFSHQFLNSVQDNKNFAYVRSRKRITDFAFDKTSGLDVQIITHYFGSRESEAYIRIYDCLPVHKFEAQRFEVEFKGEKSRFLSRILSDFRCHDDTLDIEFQKELAKYATGSLLLIDRSTLDSSNNLDRCDILPEWTDYLSKIDSALVPERLSPPRPPKTIERNDDWILRQVCNSLLIRLDAFGSWKKLQSWLFSLFSHKATLSGFSSVRHYTKHLLSTDIFSASLHHHYSSLNLHV